MAKKLLFIKKPWIDTVNTAPNSLIRSFPAKGDQAGELELPVTPATETKNPHQHSNKSAFHHNRIISQESAAPMIIREMNV